MFKDITIGQYVRGESFVHSLNPTVKLICFLLVMIAIFLCRTPGDAGLVALFFFLSALFTGIPITYLMKGIRPLAFLIFLTFFLQLFFGGTGPTGVSRVIFTLGPLEATQYGLEKGLEVLFRLLFLVMFTSVLTLTTTPISLTFGIEKLLSPFNRMGLPVHEFALMLTIALRFIPTLVMEADKIVKAQKARGADFESGGLISRVKNFLPLLIPLFLNSFKRAEELSLAMEVKCYTGGEGRTRMKSYPVKGRDLLAFIAVCAILSGVVFY
ncbi:MAG: transporter [Candidatus Wallbacteria bacterium HGW-Wallbacteria-1]|jgi:energy-coupling factor transport system permease protein|uniref:Transporter n=1 Tax=Candidatus Wallbacteria bacterium HGW-Wallbacteria-1 TaxID=2013854 RepID=A0A2N1PST1_9BACT|nr:MAG: transporter [Candidatus Wallbacteria bacterium HGW-Wallbacteria-1]